MTVHSGVSTDEVVRRTAEQALDALRAATGGRAVEADATVSYGTSALTRFAHSAIHQNVTDTALEVSLRVHLDGRTASVGRTLPTTGEHAEALADLAGRAVEAARLLPPDEAWPGLAGPADLGVRGNVDEATLDASPADRAAVVAAFVEAAGGLSTAGAVQTRGATVCLASTTGHLVTDRSSAANVDAIARAPYGDAAAGRMADGVARAAGPALSALDGAALGRTAAAKAATGTEPQEIPPGRYEVVLEPSAVADILYFCGIYGFNARAVNESRSFVRVGEAQFDPAVSVVDDAAAAGTVGLGFDAEGTPKRRVELVADGVTTSLAHDRRTAVEAGAASTGHAVAGGEAVGAFPVNVALLGGTGGSTAELVGAVGRGLLVSDFWYTRVLDPRTLVVTGLTRNGVWLIEDGEVVGPVDNVRFTQSYPESLAPGNVLGVGSQPASLPVLYGSVVTSCPPLRLGSWNVTGNATG